jgi:uncharacterized protein YdiU (UPF0061 family)
MLSFDNRWIRTLPGDPSDAPGSRAVLDAAWSSVRPTPVRAPATLAIAPEVAALLGFAPEDLHDPGFAEVFAGNRTLPGMAPYAACYGGHQFGHWAGQLGDGRAITLGEVIGPSGRFELQLKGAGPTPYSRRADGRAVLRSSIREFLCSEAMHHLGVPTTRALSLVATGEPVLRDLFYDGRAAYEPGAVVCRVAPSFLRFGSYELAPRRGERALLQALVNWTLGEHYPHLASQPDAVLALFHEVGLRTVKLVTEWMRVGFVHGVLNTDNMSILGLTLDYGPYGWLEPFDPAWTPNTTDAQGRRYAFGNQPPVVMWNLTRLAEALVPLVGATRPFEAELEALGRTLDAEMGAMWAAKLGVPEPDLAIVQDLLSLLEASETDYTLFFRRLADVTTADWRALGDVWYRPLAQDLAAAWDAWLARYLGAVRAVPNRRDTMNAVNPLYVPRNYLVHQAIERATAGDPSGITELLEVFRRPYTEGAADAAYAAKRPDWARDRPGCSALSCSS